MLASPITVTIALGWNVTLVGKPIPASFTTQVTNGTVLLDIINKVADEDPEGPFNRYVSTYHGSLMGYSVTAFNGTEQVRYNRSMKAGTNNPERATTFYPYIDSPANFDYQIL